MKSMMMVMAFLVAAVMTVSAIEETWTNRNAVDVDGNPVVDVVWKFESHSPAIQITGIYAEDGKIAIRGIRGYYFPSEVSIVGVAWSDRKDAFLVTYRLRKWDNVQAFFLDVKQTDFVEYAKRMAQKAYPKANIGDHPTVVWDSDVISLNFKPLPEGSVTTEVREEVIKLIQR